MASGNDTVIRVELMQLIDKGADGAVYKTRRLDTYEIIALKTPFLDTDPEKRNIQIEFLRTSLPEIERLRHINLVQHLHHQLNPLVRPVESQEYQIFMEFCPGKTLGKVAREGVVTPELLQKWTRQILDGVAYLHSNGFVHRDIKGDNIMLSSLDLQTAVIKIVDLGTVKKLLRDATMTREVSNSKGTYAFMSPEMIVGEDQEIEPPGARKRLGRRTDIWSVGCVVLEMLVGTLPQFYRATPVGDRVPITGNMAVMYFVGSGGNPTVPEGLPKVVENFVGRCLQRNPNKRPWAHELMDDPMLTANAEEIAEWTLPRRNVR